MQGMRQKNGGRGLTGAALEVDDRHDEPGLLVLDTHTYQYAVLTAILQYCMQYLLQYCN